VSGHFVERCKCGKVVAQCRCPGPNKVVRIAKEPCNDCKAEKAQRA